MPPDPRTNSPVNSRALLIFITLLILLSSQCNLVHAVNPKRGPLLPLNPNAVQYNLDRGPPENPRELQARRPGRPPKPIAERVYRPREGPYQYSRHNYSREKKIEVLMFLHHHRVIDRDGSYRAPSQVEAARWFKISQQRISHWKRHEQEILSTLGGRYRQGNAQWVCEWPQMEQKLFTLFLERREMGKMVGRGWFRCAATRLFRELYGAEHQRMFVFSLGWFQRFLRRWGISCRALTKKASKLPQEYRRLVINFLRYNRRHLIHAEQIHNPIPLSRILNLDETPIPFEYLDGRTYDLKGVKTVSARSARSGWDKRQATLILYIFADGVSRIPPKIIFHGIAGDKNRSFQNEKNDYHADVTVEFNPTAYNNENLFLSFIDRELAPALNPALPPARIHDLGRRSLLLMDVFAGHVTPAVQAKLKEWNITPSLIPGGCTGLLQPLDTAVNKPFKAYLREYTDRYVEKEEQRRGQEIEKWSVSGKRIMTTHVVAKAWEEFCDTKQQLVIKSFRDVGVTLRTDGSLDATELRVKTFQGADLAERLVNYMEDLPPPEGTPEAGDNEYLEIPIPGEDNCCLEYTWQAEGLFGMNHDNDNPGFEDEVAALQRMEEPGGGQIITFGTVEVEPGRVSREYCWSLDQYAHEGGHRAVSPPPTGGFIINF